MTVVMKSSNIFWFCCHIRVRYKKIQLFKILAINIFFRCRHVKKLGSNMKKFFHRNTTKNIFILEINHFFLKILIIYYLLHHVCFTKEKWIQIAHFECYSFIVSWYIFSVPYFITSLYMHIWRTKNFDYGK